MNSEPTRQSNQLPPTLDAVVVTRVRDLVDGFKVRRVLPSARRRMVGPFIFLDQMGPEILGAVELVRGGEIFEAGQLVIFKPREEVTLAAALSSGARLMLLGGEPSDGARHVWWNFVSSSKERIEQAKEDWMGGRFPPVIGESEYIPLPGSGPAVVRYP